MHSVLNDVKVKMGDVFFLETGTLHAIGAGLAVVEIQQASHITYRMYDFDRVDAPGNERDLNVDLALGAINYEKTNTFNLILKKLTSQTKLLIVLISQRILFH